MLAALNALLTAKIALIATLTNASAVWTAPFYQGLPVTPVTHNVLHVQEFQQIVLSAKEGST